MVLRGCPFCHRPFVARLLSKEQIDANEISKVSNFPLTYRPRVRVPRSGLHASAAITYKTTYQCKHCGKKWTKLSVEDKTLPPDYIQDEEEETYYDARVEEERTREEKYAKE